MVILNRKRKDKATLFMIPERISFHWPGPTANMEFRMKEGRQNGHYSERKFLRDLLFAFTISLGRVCHLMNGISIYEDGPEGKGRAGKFAGAATHTDAFFNMREG